MTQLTSTRIQSIDLLRGVVMVLMALDHVRDYFHLGGMATDPTDLETTTPLLFFTRFITHFCAPVFVFLAGTSAFLYGRKKTRGQLAHFLFTRGLWLIVIEITVNTFFWWFDPAFGFINLQVLWAIGLCMIVLAGLVYLPKRIILVIGLVLIFGHNLLDGITVPGGNIQSGIWYALHQMGFVTIAGRWVSFSYPILPWIGVIATGYVFGNLYGEQFGERRRKKWLSRMGIVSIALFVLLRGLNLYGDLVPWSIQKDATLTIISFFNVTKYPPSLAFLLITLGPAFLFLATAENIRNRVSNFLLVFGRVPFFYYLLHILVIHLGAILGLIITGNDWKIMILDQDVFSGSELGSYGYPLSVVYLVWIAVVFITYPFCKKYMIYKANNKHKKWLSYL